MTTPQLTTNAIAFKEWAVVCEALARGRQTLILRKGGIHEGRAGFRVSHQEFWLLPTHFHAGAEALTPEAADLFAPPAEHYRDGQFRISHYAVVSEVLELTSEVDALALEGLHLWSAATVRERFHYKRPGLFGLIVRIFTAPQAAAIDDTPKIAGCRSWVELPAPLPTTSLTPALDDEQFAAQVAAIKQRLPA
jgi:hypothetical protein